MFPFPKATESFMKMSMPKRTSRAPEEGGTSGLAGDGNPQCEGKGTEDSGDKGIENPEIIFGTERSHADGGVGITGIDELMQFGPGEFLGRAHGSHQFGRRFLEKGGIHVVDVDRR
jgi:hypothetical protein